MKANELRIGNWIHTNIDQQVTVEHLDYLCNDAIKDKSVMHPIPLTEEWLLNFGWKKQNDTAESIGEYHWYSFGTYETRNIGKGIIGIYDVHNDATIANVSFVHQLQNLFFALTGEELQLKKHSTTSTR